MPLLNITPDVDAAEEFIQYITGGESVAFRTFDDSDGGRFGARKLSGQLSDVADQLTKDNARGAGVFWVVNQTDGKGQLDTNIVGIRSLFVDLDGSPLEPVLAEAQALPHIVVETSPGKFHCYWLVQNGMNLSDFKLYQIALAKRFNGDMSVHNPSRVLRVPGFYHVKDEKNPFKTSVVQYNQQGLYDPRDLAELLRLSLDTQRQKNVVEMFPSEFTGKIPNGARDVTLFKMGAHLRHAGLEFDEINKILQHRNATHCQEPLSEQQVRKIARQISSKESVVIQHLKKQPPSNEPAKSFNERFGIYTFEDLGNMEIDPIKWVIPDFLPQGLTILAGDPKMGKSWIAQEISYAVATGGLALGRFPTIQGSVLHLALEDPPGRFKERMESIKGAHGIFPKDGNYTNRWQTMQEHGMDHLRQWLTQTHNPKLIIIDTLEKFRGSDSQTGNVYASDYKDMAKIQKLTIEYGVAIICIHHLNKSLHTDPMSRLSGSHGISGAADLVWLFDRKSRDVLSATLRAMGRDIPDARYSLSCDTDNKAIWKCLGHIVDEDRNTTQSKILDLMRQNETCSFTSSEIADKVGRSRQNTFKELVQLTKDELIVRYEDNGAYYYGLNRAILGKGFYEETDDTWC